MVCQIGMLAFLGRIRVVCGQGSVWIGEMIVLELTARGIRNWPAAGTATSGHAISMVVNRGEAKGLRANVAIIFEWKEGC